MIRETTVRVVTWNLWCRFGPWQQRQGAILDTLRRVDADIVTLQEVWGEPGGASLAGYLADGLGLQHTFGPCSQLDGIEVGNAVLSRWPIAAAEHHPLPAAERADGWTRGLTMAWIAGPRGDLLACSTHLAHDYDDSALRQQQVRSIARLVADAGRDGCPPILAGDLNADPGCDEVRMLTGRTAVPVPGLVFHDAWEVAGRGRGHTWSNRNPHARGSLAPDRRIDYVLVGPTGPEGSGHVVSARLAGTSAVHGVVPSDHYAVVAQLRY